MNINNTLSIFETHWDVVYYDSFVHLALIKLSIYNNITMTRTFLKSEVQNKFNK